MNVSNKSLIKTELKNLENEISSLKFISRNIQHERKSATDQLSILNEKKYQLKIRLTQIKAKDKEASLTDEVKSIQNRSATCTNSISACDKKIEEQKKILNDLENQLKSLEFIHNFNNVSDEINKCKEDVAKYKSDLEKLDSEKQSLNKDLNNNEVSINAIKVQLANLKRKADLKEMIALCEASIKNKDNSKKEKDELKSKLKQFVNEVRHTVCLSKLKAELKKASDNLANLEYLKNNNLSINANEIKETSEKIVQLEKQISAEVKKFELQKELQEAETTVLNLTPLKGVPGIEDVTPIIKATEEKIKKLKLDIEEITNESLNIVKKLQNRIVVASPAAAAPITVSIPAAVPNLAAPVIAVPSAAAAPIEGISIVKILEEELNRFFEELKKWLSENVLEEALINADLQESIVTAAILRFSKGMVQLPAANNEGLANKIKNVALGACTKFSLGQVVQFMVTNNLPCAAVFGAAAIAQHGLLDDGQVSTFVDKLKSFAVGELFIKYFGNMLLGNLVMGTLGTALSIPAALYLLFNFASQYRTVSTNDLNDLVDAGSDMVADASIDAISNKTLELLGNVEIIAQK